MSRRRWFGRPKIPWEVASTDDRRRAELAAMRPSERSDMVAARLRRFIGSDPWEAETEEFANALEQAVADERFLASHGLGIPTSDLYTHVDRAASAISDNARGNTSEFLINTWALQWELAKEAGGGAELVAEHASMVVGLMRYSTTSRLTDTGRAFVETCHRHEGRDAPKALWAQGGFQPPQGGPTPGFLDGEQAEAWAAARRVGSIDELVSQAVEAHHAGRFGLAYFLTGAAQEVLRRPTEPGEYGELMGFYPTGLLAHTSSLGELRERHPSPSLENLEVLLAVSKGLWLVAEDYHGYVMSRAYMLPDAIAATMEAMAMLGMHVTNLEYVRLRDFGARGDWYAQLLADIRIFDGILHSVGLIDVQLDDVAHEWREYIETERPGWDAKWGS